MWERAWVPITVLLVAGKKISRFRQCAALWQTDSNLLRAANDCCANAQSARAKKRLCPKKADRSPRKASYSRFSTRWCYSYILPPRLLFLCRQRAKMWPMNQLFVMIRSVGRLGEVLFLSTVFAKCCGDTHMWGTRRRGGAALRWLMIGECLLAPQNHQSSFLGLGWTPRSLSTGPCCVTTYN